MAADADGGLYEGLPPDATVDSIVEDDANPGWSTVYFSDGREARLPTDSAREYPMTPHPPPTSQGAYPGEVGPPLPPEGPPLPPPAAELPPPGPPPVPDGFTAVPPVDPSARPGVVPAGPMTVRGNSFRPAGALPDAGVDAVPATVGASTTGPAPDYSEVVQPATAGGFGPYSESDQTTVARDTYVDDPQAMQARLSEAGEAAAQSAYEQDVAAYDASVGAKHTAAAAQLEREAALKERRRVAELAEQEQARIIQGIEDNPIDEDGFWSASPGRRAGAFIALALSGFLQGVSRGANPAMNQMLQALQSAKSSWLQNQQSQRESTLRRREKAMGDAHAAVLSLDMQIDGVVSKYMDLQAQAAGVPLPPSLSAQRAKLQLHIAEKQNELGRIPIQRATETAQAERRATPGQPAMRRGDVVLRELLGVDPNSKEGRAVIDDAYSPAGGNVPGAVDAATRLEGIRNELQAIKQKYGDLPQQALFSYNTFGAAAFAGRLGSEAGQDQVRAKALLLEAQQMVKQSAGTTKLFDSNQERDDLIKTIDTGEPASTLAAIDRLTQRANTNAISAAQRYTRDPQGFIDYLRESRAGTKGVGQQSERGSAVEQGVRRRLTPPTAQPTAQPQPAQEGAAAPPLGQAAGRSAAREAVRRALRQ